MTHHVRPQPHCRGNRPPVGSVRRSAGSGSVGTIDDLFGGEAVSQAVVQAGFDPVPPRVIRGIVVALAIVLPVEIAAVLVLLGVCGVFA